MVSKKRIFLGILFFVLSFSFSLCVNCQPQTQSFDGFYRHGNIVEILKITVAPSGFGLGVCKNCQIAGVRQTIYFRIGRNPQYPNILDCYNANNVRIGAIARNQTQIPLRLINVNNQVVREIPFLLIGNLEDKLKYIGERLYRTLDKNTEDLKNMNKRRELLAEIRGKIDAKLMEVQNHVNQKKQNMSDTGITQRLKTSLTDFSGLLRKARGLNSRYEYDELDKNLRTVSEILSVAPLASLLGLELPRWIEAKNRAISAKKATIIPQLDDVERDITGFESRVKNILQGTGVVFPND